jgi:LCP family protein required for cell wall assembly
MARDHDDDEPAYTVYRSRPRLLGRREEDVDDVLGELRSDGPRPAPQPAPRRRRRLPRFTFWRVVGYVLGAVLIWVMVSAILFLVSAQIERQKVSDDARAALSDSGFTLTSPNTVLVLGSDARTKGTREAGAQTIGQPSRSDSIMLLRIGGGRNATLSIPRDTVVNIPGHGQGKINAAYAIGGPALAIRTVEEYLGTPVNHLVEVNFENFPALIDALGGIEYTGGCVVSRINGGFKNGGYTLRLHSGSTHIDGKQALALARTRHNLCNPRESDLTRARRQQKIFAAMKSQVIGFAGFLRGPFIGWKAPTAIRSDMSGPTLLGMAAALATSGTAPTHVLRPSGGVTLPDGGAGLTVSDAEKRSEVQRFLDG